jgi:hypothetical protein
MELAIRGVSRDRRPAQRGDLPFDLFEAQKGRRPLKIRVHGEHLCGLVEHGCYQQSWAHDPELELLFTQAETAW